MCLAISEKEFRHPWSFRVEMIFAGLLFLSKDSARYSGNKWSKFAADAHTIGYCERIKNLDDVPERARRSNKGFQSAMLVLNLCARISSVSWDTRRNIHETVMPTRYGITTSPLVSPNLGRRVSRFDIVI